MSALWKDLSRPGDAESRTLIVLHGEDTERFLQGTLSQDVAALRDDEALPASLLTVKGKLVSDAILLSLGEDRYGLAVPALLADEVAANLDRHIIMDDVEVELDRARALALRWGEGAPAGHPEARVFRTRYPLPGHLVLGTPAGLAQALGGAEEADGEAWALARVQAGVPAWGAELQADRFPPEVGFVASVSYDKGCFMGQEPLARIHARGQVNRVLVRVRADEPQPRPALPVALHHPEREDAGELTTLAADGDGLSGLAVVRRKVAEQGTELRAGGLTLRVVSAPLGDDPGVGGRKGPATVKLGSR